MATTTTPQQRLFDVLLERVRQDRYPSHQLLNRIEANLYTSQQVTDYMEVLTDKIDECWYPSHQMITRAERLLGMVADIQPAPQQQDDED